MNEVMAPSGSLRTLILNVLLFQVGWFACVLGGTAPWLVFVLGLLAVHVLFVAEQGEMRFLLAIAAMGSLMDSLLMQSGWMTFPDWSAQWIPPWLMLLWLLFASTLRHALRWLYGRWWLAAVLGGLGGSSSYLAGAELGAAELPQGRWLTFLVFTLIWAIIFPLMLWLSQHPRLRTPAQP